MPANWKKLYIIARRAALAWAVFFGGLAVAALCWFIADARVEKHARTAAEGAINQASDQIRERLQRSHDVMYGAQAYFNTSEEVTREEFNRYVSGLKLPERHPAIRSLSYAELVGPDARSALEEKVRGDRSLHAGGYPNFSVRPAGERPQYLPIVYIEPFSMNETALGLDLLGEERRETVERARDTGVPVVSGRLNLASDPVGDIGFTVRLALYRPGMPTRTIDERRAAFAGVVSTSFTAKNVVGDILSNPSLAAMTVRLYDRLAIPGANEGKPLEYVLFEKIGPAVSDADRRYFDRRILIEIGGREWLLHFTGSTADFVTPTDRALPWILFLGTLVMSGLLAGLISSLASSRERAHRLAARITEDLRRSEAQLAEAQRLTQSMLEALPNPIFFKGTDGRYRGVNQAWEKFFGIPRTAFIGKTVHDLYPNDRTVADRLHALDQALWDRPGAQTYEAMIPAADGARHDVVYYKATYARSDGNVVGLIGTIIDISERKQSERRQAMEHAITRVLAEADSIAIAVPRIIQTICETMGWHYGDRYDYDAELGMLRRREFWAVDTTEMRVFADSASHRAVRPDASGTGLVRRTYTTAKPVWIADVAKELSLQRRELVERAGLHGAFAFPLTASGQVLGVLEFFHRDVREPDAMLIQIAESIGSQIGQFIVRMKAEEAVKFVAMHDALTQLPNRVMFNERLEQAIAQSQRHDKKLAVMFIDLDRFKIINDTLGHESGDQLLREVAQRITENLRTGDMVARLGGDEFVVLIEDVADPVLVGSVAEKLIAALTANFVIGGREVHVTASIGISSFPRDAQDMRSLLKFADIAMYRAKEQGRNTFQFYSEHINVHSVERLTLESQLRGALSRNELVVHYQPVIHANGGDIVGMEALVRWQHPEAGLLSPARFISIAEDTGLIVPIGEFVLETACAQQRRWVEMGLPSLRVAVNLSPRQFVHRHIVEDIVRVLSKTGCDTSNLELEITEGTVMHNPPRAVALLSELKTMGIRIAIDDFGTGYSSLAYLKRFPIDSLKIDRSFLADVPRDSSNTAITEAIIAMAHSLKLKVIAEGVETLDQLTYLREQGCDEAQGYYISTPLSADDATELLRRPPIAAVSNVTPFERRR